MLFYQYGKKRFLGEGKVRNEPFLYKKTSSCWTVFEIMPPFFKFDLFEKSSLNVAGSDIEIKFWAALQDRLGVISRKTLVWAPKGPKVGPDGQKRWKIKVFEVLQKKLGEQIKLRKWMLESFCSISEGASFGFDKMPKFQIPNAQNAKIPIFFTTLEPPTATRPWDQINLSLYAKYSLNLLLSRYVSIFGIIFNILVNICTVAEEW